MEKEMQMFVRLRLNNLSLSLLLVHVFVPQYLVQDPVEYVEEEEGEREAGPRHSVDLFGSVDEQLPHLLRASTPAGCCRCILGSVLRRGSRRVQRTHGVVGAGLRLLAVARGGGHGGGRGRPALVCPPFLLERRGGRGGAGGGRGRGSQVICESVHRFDL